MKKEQFHQLYSFYNVRQRYVPMKMMQKKWQTRFRQKTIFVQHKKLLFYVFQSFHWIFQQFFICLLDRKRLTETRQKFTDWSILHETSRADPFWLKQIFL